jgi:hypothetical protein
MKLFIAKALKGNIEWGPDVDVELSCGPDGHSSRDPFWVKIVSAILPTLL